MCLCFQEEHKGSDQEGLQQNQALLPIFYLAYLAYVWLCTRQVRQFHLATTVAVPVLYHPGKGLGAPQLRTTALREAGSPM